MALQGRGIQLQGQDNDATHRASARCHVAITASVFGSQGLANNHDVRVVRSTPGIARHGGSSSVPESASRMHGNSVRPEAAHYGYVESSKSQLSVQAKGISVSHVC